MRRKHIINMLLAVMIPVSIMVYRESLSPEASLWHISAFVAFLVVALIVNITHDGRGLHDYIDKIKRAGR